MMIMTSPIDVVVIKYYLVQLKFKLVVMYYLVQLKFQSLLFLNLVRGGSEEETNSACLGVDNDCNKAAFGSLYFRRTGCSLGHGVNHAVNQKNNASAWVQGW